jgi:hypothetical protein
LLLWVQGHTDSTPGTSFSIRRAACAYPPPWSVEELDSRCPAGSRQPTIVAQFCVQVRKIAIKIKITAITATEYFVTRRGKKSKLRKSLVKKAKKERKKEEKKSNPEVDRSDVKPASPFSS